MVRFFKRFDDHWNANLYYKTMQYDTQVLELLD